MYAIRHNDDVVTVSTWEKAVILVTNIFSGRKETSLTLTITSDKWKSIACIKAYLHKDSGEVVFVPRLTM